MKGITFAEGALILIGFACAYYVLARIVLAGWRWWLNRYLDRHPDVERELYGVHGKVRKDKPWDVVRVDETGRALESSGEWLDRIGRR